MKKMDNDLLKFHQQYKNNLNKLEKEHPFIVHFYDSFLAGQTELYQKEISETKIFDEEWIETLESYFPSINKIILNPLSGLKVIEEVSPIEKARKINSRSIKHLAANTHMLKEVKEDGTVIPSRILTSYTDIDFELYENRFIMTLIDRLFIFVRTRYNIIKENVESFDKRQVKIKSSFPINETIVDFNLDVTLTDEIENKEVNIYNRELLERVEELNKLVTSLKTSHFMNNMKDARRIHPPIMKTNIILRNRDYHNAYLLWLFMDKYNTLPFTLDVIEKDLGFDDDYLTDIKRQTLSTFSAIIANHENSKNKYQEIKPRKHSFESIKIITEEPGDIERNPKDIVIEEQMINEYYLAMYEKIFASSLEKYEETTKTDTAILKKTLRDTLQISNALYESYFDLNKEVDVFEKLIQKTSVSDSLEETQRRIRVAQIIREVKQVDYNDSLRLERRLLAELGNYYDLLLKEQLKDIKNQKTQLELEKANIQKQKIIAINRENLALELENVKSKRDEIHELRIENFQEIRTYQSKLNKELNDEISNYERKLDNETKETLEGLNKEYESFKNELKILEESLIKEEEKSLSEALNKINKEHEELLKEQKRKLELEKERLIKEQMAQIEANKQKALNLLELKKAKLEADNKEAIEAQKAKLEQKRLEREKEQLKKDVLNKLTPLTTLDVKPVKKTELPVLESKQKEVSENQQKEREQLKKDVLNKLTPLTNIEVKPVKKTATLKEEKLKEKEELKKTVLQELGPYTKYDLKNFSRRNINDKETKRND